MRGERRDRGVRCDPCPRKFFLFSCALDVIKLAPRKRDRRGTKERQTDRATDGTVATGSGSDWRGRMIDTTREDGGGQGRRGEGERRGEERREEKRKEKM